MARSAKPSFWSATCVLDEVGTTRWTGSKTPTSRTLALLPRPPVARTSAPGSSWRRNMRTVSDTMDTPAGATPHLGLVVGIAVVAALGGLLFGYDTGIIGVALLGLGRQFALDDTAKQLVTGAIIFGALFGCLGTGPLSDRFGRKRMVVFVGVLFALGSIASAMSPNVELLIAS